MGTCVSGSLGRGLAVAVFGRDHPMIVDLIVETQNIEVMLLGSRAVFTCGKRK